MKNILFVSLLMLTSGLLRAAYFEYHASGYWVQSSTACANTTESDPYNDPGTPWRETRTNTDTNPSIALADSSAAVSTATGSTAGSAQTQISGQTVTLTFDASASGQTTTPVSFVYAYTYAGSRDWSTADGIYFKIVSDFEPNGTPVLVRLQWNAQADLTSSDNGYFNVSNSVNGDGVLITRNGTIGYGVPSADSVIYRHNSLFYSSIGNHTVSDSVDIMAAVGDVLGVYVECLAYVYGENTLINKSITGQYTISAEILAATTNPADINKDNQVNLEDLALLAANWLWIEPAPVNQTCANALLVQANAVYEDSTANSGGELWYQLRPWQPTRYVASLCGSQFDTRLTSYDTWIGSGTCPGNYLGENDDDCGQQSQLAIDGWNDTIYYLKVDSPTAQTGNLRLEITGYPKPVNDDAFSSTVTALDTVYTGTTIGSFYDAYVWYEFTPQDTDFYTLSLCGSSFDTTIELYDVVTWTLRDYNDNFCGTQSSLAAELQSGIRYQIAVGNSNGLDRGNYQFQITRGAAAPSNDDCTSPAVISQWQQIESSTAVAAGTDISSCESGDSRDVWYQFTAPAAATYTFYLDSYYYDNNAKTISIYDGSCAGTELFCGPTAFGWISAPLSLSANQQVLIRIGGYPSTGGQFRLLIN